MNLANDYDRAIKENVVYRSKLRREKTPKEMDY